MSRINSTTLELAQDSDKAQNIVPHCPVCNSTEWRPFRKGTDIRRPKQQFVFRIDRCQTCGHLMQNPLPSAEELRQSYAVEYPPYRPAWKEPGWRWWKVLRYLTTARNVHQLKKFARGNRVLDVGCGAGDFLFEAHRAGWQVAAVEYNQPLAEMLRAELKFDVHPGELEYGLWQPESFDAVTIWSVIEHVPDPVASIKMAASYLRKDGVLLLKFPTAQGLSHGNAFSQYWEIVDLPRHINYFGKSSLSTLCNGLGLELMDYKTFFIDSAWCWYTSSMNFAKAAKSKILKYVRLTLLAPVTIFVLPYLALLAWRGCGTEAWVAVRKN